jgi:hypothetical protein
MFDEREPFWGGRRLLNDSGVFEQGATPAWGGLLRFSGQNILVKYSRLFESKVRARFCGAIKFRDLWNFENNVAGFTRGERPGLWATVRAPVIKHHRKGGPFIVEITTSFTRVLVDVARVDSK